TRSDIYALGLVLFEIFTGKRASDGSSSSKISSVSSVVRDIDPAIERVVARCLDDNPAARPPSAHAVIASLPGGDPLAAALAAGETPSPEMVAAAGAVGDVRPAVAWPIFALAVLGVMAVALMANRSLLFRLVALKKSTEVLQSRAEEIVDRLGY